jgi:hypothetical protein
LEQRSPENTVMPGMWELPAIVAGERAGFEERLTVRHAIMQVNYVVRVFAVTPEGLQAHEEAAGARRWIRLAEASAIALTGLSRKVLSRAGLTQTASCNRSGMVAPRTIRELV